MLINKLANIFNSLSSKLSRSQPNHYQEEPSESTQPLENNGHILRDIRRINKTAQKLEEEHDIPFIRGRLLVALYELFGERSIKFPEILESLQGSEIRATKSMLDRLSNMELVEKYKPPHGVETLPVHRRKGQILDHNRVHDEVEEEIDNLIRHTELTKNESLQEHLAYQFEVPSDKIVQYLNEGTAHEMLEKLNTAIDTIEASPEFEKGDGYDRIEFVHMPYRYKLSQKAIDLLKSMDDI